MLFVRPVNTILKLNTNSPAAKGGDPKLSDIVSFSADFLSLGSK